MNTLTREEMTFTFDGPTVEKHEIEASLLADSLLSLKSLAERANKLQHGKDAELFFKVKAGFKQGSFGVDLIIDWVVQHPSEAAVLGATAIASVPTGVAAAIAGVIKLVKWVKAKPYTTTELPGGRAIVVNGDGASLNFSTVVVNMANTSSVKRELDRLTRPLDSAGVDKISLSGIQDEDPVEVSQEERPLYSLATEPYIRDTMETLTLEIVTPNLWGESTGWRFYDGGVEFPATVEDTTFLTSIQTGAQAFKTGDMIEANVRIVQRRKQRLVTDRTIIEVLAYIPSGKVEPTLA